MPNTINGKKRHDRPGIYFEQRKGSNIGIAIVCGFDKTFIGQSLIEVDDFYYDLGIVRRGADACAELTQEKADEWLEQELGYVLQLSDRLSARNEPQLEKILRIADKLGVAFVIGSNDDSPHTLRLVTRAVVDAELAGKIDYYSYRRGVLDGTAMNPVLARVMHDKGIGNRRHIVYMDSVGENVKKARDGGFMRAVHADPAMSSSIHLKKMLEQMLAAEKGLVEEKRLEEKLKGKNTKLFLKDLDEVCEQLQKATKDTDIDAAILNIDEDRLFRHYNGVKKELLAINSRCADEIRAGIGASESFLQATHFPTDTELKAFVNRERLYSGGSIYQDVLELADAGNEYEEIYDRPGDSAPQERSVYQPLQMENNIYHDARSGSGTVDEHPALSADNTGDGYYYVENEIFRKRRQMDRNETEDGYEEVAGDTLSDARTDAEAVYDDMIVPVNAADRSRERPGFREGHMFGKNSDRTSGVYDELGAINDEYEQVDDEVFSFEKTGADAGYDDLKFPEHAAGHGQAKSDIRQGNSNAGNRDVSEESNIYDEIDAVILGRSFAGGSDNNGDFALQLAKPINQDQQRTQTGAHQRKQEHEAINVKKNRSK